MTINFEDLTTAAKLCTCGAVCTRSCDVCASVTWKGGLCVRQQLDNFVTQPEQPPTEVNDLEFGTVFKPGDTVPLADVLQPIPYAHDRTRRPNPPYGEHQAPGPDGVVCEKGCDAWSVDPVCPQHGTIEQFIDYLEDRGMTLQPWQAHVLRLVLGSKLR